MEDEKNQLPDDLKSLTRRAMITTRDALSASTRTDAEKSIATHLQSWLDQHQPRILAAYLPIRGEVDCRDWLLQVRRTGVKVLLPVVEQRDGPLVFREWGGEALTDRDLAGVRAPLYGQALQPDAVLVPCVGFNAQGYRLGYGGGYYDRTLAALPGVHTAGVAFSIQGIQFPVDDHDIALQSMITELGIWNF